MGVLHYDYTCFPGYNCLLKNNKHGTHVVFMILNASSRYLYIQGQEKPESLSSLHSPYFLVFTPPSMDIHQAREKLLKQSDTLDNAQHKLLDELEAYINATFVEKASGRQMTFDD